MSNTEQLVAHKSHINRALARTFGPATASRQRTYRSRPVHWISLCARLPLRSNIYIYIYIYYREGIVEYNALFERTAMALAGQGSLILSCMDLSPIPGHQHDSFGLCTCTIMKSGKGFLLAWWASYRKRRP